MTNLNTMWWIGSAERSRNYPQLTRFSSLEDEQQFKNWHDPMPTENRKQLQENFDERAKIEEELHGLKEEKRKLVAKGDELQKRLLELERSPASSPEEDVKKQEEINSIKEEIRKVNEEIMKIKEEMKMKEQELYKSIDKVEEAKKLVIEDEHTQNQLDDEIYRSWKEEKLEFLMSQL